MTVVKTIGTDLRVWMSQTFASWRGDLTGGLTAAVVALPLALAFAVASGVDPKAGLYTAIVAGTIAAVCGGSPVQITRPTGAMAVILVGIPHWNDFGLIRELINPALALAALGSIESLLSAVVADGMTVSEKHDSDRELIGQGLANIVVPFFGGIPATGAIARTAVNVRSGGKTRLSGVIQGVAIAIIVLTLAPLAAQVSLAALAGILMVTSVRMIEWEAIGLLMRATYADFAVMMLTWMVTIFFDLVLAVEVGLIAAGALFIKIQRNTQ